MTTPCPDSNCGEFAIIRSQAGLNSYKISVKEWVERAEYGETIVQALTAQLEPEFGRGFGKRNLFTMVRFATAIPDEQIVSALRRQLTWTHFHFSPFPSLRGGQRKAAEREASPWGTKQSLGLERLLQAPHTDRGLRNDGGGFLPLVASEGRGRLAMT